MLKHVLVTLDGSELAERALAYSQDLVCGSGQITLLSVVNAPDVLVYGNYPVPVAVQSESYNDIVDSAREQARTYVDEICSRMRADGATVTGVVDVGEPAQVIIEQAKKLDVDAVVMSTHGRTGFSRWLFGSVTHKVLSAMPCPVFVVPGQSVEESPEEQVESSQA